MRSPLLRFRRFARACALLTAFTLIFIGSASRAVTLTGDPVPHMWHSFNTPENSFLGYTDTSWSTTAASALYAEWGGFIPISLGSWTFDAPTVGLSAQTSAVLTETSGTGMLTGTGNIYGLAFGQVPGPPLIFNLIVTDLSGAVHSSGATRTVVMRSGTKGVLPDMVVTLNGIAATGVNTFRVDGTIDMPTGPGGALEPNTTTDGEWIWVWTQVPATGPFRFDFKATVGHMSLDNLAVYASPPRTATVTPPPVVQRRYSAVPTNGIAQHFGAVLSEQIAP